MRNAEETRPNPNTPKRDGDPLDGLDPRRAKMGEAGEGEMGDQVFSARHAIGLLGSELAATATEEQLH